LVPLIVVLTAGLSYPSQQGQHTDKISSVKDQRKSGPVPIYFAKDKDSLPESFEMTGKVVAQQWEPYCGDLAQGSTLKIRPSQKIDGYNPEFVYMIIGCTPETNHNFTGKTVRIDAKKTYESDIPCHCSTIQNDIDSHGIPFYCAEHIKILPD
jgi:hypothetical protein